MKLKHISWKELDTVIEKCDVGDIPVKLGYQLEDGYLLFLFCPNHLHEKPTNVWKFNFKGERLWKIQPGDCDPNEYTCSYLCLYHQDEQLIVRNIMAGDYILNPTDGSIKQVPDDGPKNKVLLRKLTDQSALDLAKKFFLPYSKFEAVYEVSGGYIFFYIVDKSSDLDRFNILMYDYDGAFKWRVQDTGFGSPKMGPFLDPYVDNGKLIISDFSSVEYILDTKDGSTQYYGITL